jgi:hypothetical protein
MVSPILNASLALLVISTGLQTCCLFCVWLTLQLGLLLKTSKDEGGQGGTMTGVISTAALISPLVLALLVVMQVLNHAI